SRRRHTRSKRDWSSDVCSSDLAYRLPKLLELCKLIGGNHRSVEGTDANSADYIKAVAIFIEYFQCAGLEGTFSSAAGENQCYFFVFFGHGILLPKVMISR